MLSKNWGESEDFDNIKAFNYWKSAKTRNFLWLCYIFEYSLITFQFYFNNYSERKDKKNFRWSILKCHSKMSPSADPADVLTRFSSAVYNY